MYRRIGVEAVRSAQASESGDKDDPVDRLVISARDAVLACASPIQSDQWTIDAMLQDIVLHLASFRGSVMAKRHAGRGDAMTYDRHEWQHSRRGSLARGTLYPYPAVTP
jgi:hypothetical protein